MAATVLIADNDPGVRALLAEVVRRLGCHVLEAADGIEAKARLQAGPVHVLVCDLDMPRATGEEVLAFAARCAAPPAAVVVSGYLDAQTQARLLALGCVRAVLHKPFDVLAFGELVGGLCRPAGAARQGGAEGRA